jgi:hypothetical protein
MKKMIKEQLNEEMGLTKPWYPGRLHGSFGTELQLAPFWVQNAKF